MRLLLTALLLLSAPSFAQEAPPQLPEPIQNLANEGAQIRYLGNDGGLDGWVTIKGGQEQYFYVLPDGKSFVMGVLFDESGKLITVEQVRKLQANGDESLETLTKDPMFMASDNAGQDTANTNAAERMYSDIESANWITLGNADSPVIYALIDPQCPHCHAFINDVRELKALENSAIQLRLIPVGFREDTMKQAAYLLAAPDSGQLFLRHIDGSTLPVRDDITLNGVERNLALMQNWDFSVTPMLFYRDKNEEIKIVRGRPKDAQSIISDVQK